LADDLRVVAVLLGAWSSSSKRKGSLAIMMDERVKGCGEWIS
jgi:hypothetical protein